MFGKIYKKIKKKLKFVKKLRTVVSATRDGVELEVLDTSKRIKLKGKSLKFNINYMFNGGEYNLTAKRNHNDKNPEISFNNIKVTDPEINIDWKGVDKIYIVYELIYQDGEGVEHQINLVSDEQDISKIVKWFIKQITGIKI